jgi:sphingomyelin phosphodiesterase 2
MNRAVRWELLFVIVGALVTGGCSSEGGGKASDTSEARLSEQAQGRLSEPITLKVVTFNVWDYYVFPDHRMRMKEIGRFLKWLDPDLVGMQEAFLKKDRELMLEQLKGSRLLYSHYYPSGLSGSGLMILSAFPISETSFQQYTEGGPWYKPWQGDWYAGKGVALARIDLPGDSGSLDFYNTHAIAGYEKYNDLHVEERLSQMKDLAAFVEASSSNAAPAILVGDMNCGPGDEEYEAVIEDAGLVRLMNIDSRIDHIFGIGNSNYDFSVVETRELSRFTTEDGEEITLSDHNCYVSEIKIEPAK